MHKYRKSAVAGMFYPDSCQEIKHYIKHFESLIVPSSLDVIPRALIVPHAGYIYSGFTATLAYHYTASKRTDIERVVVIGPSHRVYLSGSSVALYEKFHSPCGDVEIDLAFSHALEKAFSFVNFTPNAHEEHSTEVQIPLIRHYFKHAKIVEIVYGDMPYAELSHMIDLLLEDEKTLVIISTDLSHFYTQEEANALDEHCISAILQRDIPTLSLGCEACGITGVTALAHSAIAKNLQPHFLDYRTSFERTKDASRVVGYASFVLG